MTKLLILSGLVLVTLGCAGTGVSSAEDSFNDMVNDINLQHPPLYDGTNTSYPRSN